MRGTTIAKESRRTHVVKSIAGGRDMKSKSILLVEDDPKSKYALETVLQDHGHTVHSFSSAEEAAEASNHFDAAVIDIRLPNQQGPDFAIAFKKKNPDIRIIFITAYDSVPHLRQTLPGSVLLVKPIDMSVLTKLL
jgi:DNA-binding NtrC family response regulator